MFHRLCCWFLLLATACDRYYPLGTAGDAGAPPVATGGNGGTVGGELVPGGTGGAAQPGVEPPPPPPLAACRAGAAPIPERGLAISTQEVATRLARFLWANTPDQRLLDRAASVKTNLEVRRLAEFMLTDGRAYAGVDRLTKEWLGLHDVTIFDGADEVRGMAEVARYSMDLETTTFAQKTILEGDARLHTLLLASHSYVDERLAPLYGVTPTGPFTRVELDPLQRSGILTQASFLYLKPYASQRGNWVVQRLLCYDLPSPPTPTDPPAPGLPGETSRERIERVARPQVCAPCHVLVDPPGFAFEHYDALGRWRDQDAGKPIDATGHIAQNIIPTQPEPLKFEGARQLGEQLLQSCEVRRCVAQRFLAGALGVRDVSNDAAVAELAGAFELSGLDLRALLADVTASRPFLAP